MCANFFERYAFWKGLAIVVSIITLFSYLGFEENQLWIITFITMIVVVIAYFDNRIRKIEDKIKRFNNN